MGRKNLNVLLLCFSLMLPYYLIAGVPLAVDSNNLLLEAMKKNHDLKNYGWDINKDNWIIEWDGSSSDFQVHANLPGKFNPQNNLIQTTIQIDLSSLVNFGQERCYRFSGWMRVNKTIYMRDFFGAARLGGDCGLTEELRIYDDIEGQWNYFERRVVVPSDIRRLNVSFFVPVANASVSFRSFSVTPCSVPGAQWQQVRQSDNNITSAEKWLLNDRSFRLTGKVEAKADEPLWVDFDFARLLLLTGCRNALDPSSLKAIAVKHDGSSQELLVYFGNPFSNLYGRYKRNGTLQFKTVEGAERYEIYFNASGESGPKPLITKELSGIGEIIQYPDDFKSRAWMGWPGEGLNIKDVDNDGDWDIYAYNQDTNIWLLRNMGNNQNPLFLPMLKPTETDLAPGPKSLPVKRGDFNGDGILDTIGFDRYIRNPKDVYGGGTWVEMYVILGGVSGKKIPLADVDGKIVNFENAGWFNFDLGDFDGDGLLDIVAGNADRELVFLYNLRSGANPKPDKYEVRKKVFNWNIYEDPQDSGDMTLKPTVVDWNKDGRADLVVTGWNGFANLIINNNKPGIANFEKPVYLYQLSGVLSTADSPMPAAIDIEDNGVIDLVVGDCCGHFTYFENVGTAKEPKFSGGEWLKDEDGKIIKITAYETGATPQGIQERGWGYVCCNFVDIDGDGDQDMVINDSVGRLRWIENLGSKQKAVWSRRIRVFYYESKVVNIPWRVRPAIADFDGDGTQDIAVLDDKGQLISYAIDQKHPSFFPKKTTYKDPDGKPVLVNKLTSITIKLSGRSHLEAVDFNHDGLIDIVAGRPRNATLGGNYMFFENVGDRKNPVFKSDYMRSRGMRFVQWVGSDGHDQWHEIGICASDFNGDGEVDFIAGAESGKLTYFENSFFKGDTFAVFEAKSFDQKKSDRILQVIDFKNNTNQWKESLMPLTRPLQWLKDDFEISKQDASSRMVKIIYPKLGQKLSGEVVIEAVAEGTGIKQLDFYIDGKYVATKTGAPYTAFGDGGKWNTKTVANGKHEISVKTIYIDGVELVDKKVYNIRN